MLQDNYGDIFGIIFGITIQGLFFPDFNNPLNYSYLSFCKLYII